MLNTKKLVVKTKNSDFQSDFLSFLPWELTLKILLYLKPSDILSAGQVCRNWFLICNDDFLWREKCKKDQIIVSPEEDLGTDKYVSCKKSNITKNHKLSFLSSWKSAYMRQKRLEINWKTQSLKNSKIINYEHELLSCLQLNKKYIVSSSYGAKIINIFSIDTGKCIKKLMGHGDAITTFYLSERLIISGSNDTTLKVWCIETGENYRTLSGHTDRIRCLTVHGNKVVSGSADCSIRIWNYETGICLYVLCGHSAAIRCLEYNGILVISGSSDNTIKVWNSEKELCLKTLEGHKHEVKSLQFDGTNIVSGSLDSVRIWDVQTGCLKQTLLGYKDCFGFTSRFNTEYRKHLFAFISFYSPYPYDKVKYEVKICESATGECLQTLSDPSEESSQVQCIQFVLNFVLTSSFGNTVKLWDIKTGKFLRNVINLNWLKDGYYVKEFRASETKLVCLTEARHVPHKKFIIINFDTHISTDSRFIKSSISQKQNCNIV